MVPVGLGRAPWWELAGGGGRLSKGLQTARGPLSALQPSAARAVQGKPAVRERRADRLWVLRGGVGWC